MEQKKDYLYQIASLKNDSFYTQKKHSLKVV